MHTTVPSSEHACHTGSQWSVCRLGSPSGTGFSGKVIAWQPFFATRRTSSAIASGSQIGGIASGMNRSGAAPHHSSMCQSLYARQSASAASLSSSWPKRRPAKPGSDGKLSEPSSAVGRHVEHALLHVVGALAQLVEAGRVHAVFLGRPARDRVEPDVGDVEVEELPHVGAVGACSTRGAMSLYFAGRWCSNTSGGSTTWSSTLTRIMSSRRMTPCTTAFSPRSTAPGRAPVCSPSLQQFLAVHDDRRGSRSASTTKRPLSAGKSRT